ncbi:MAG TPA: DUF72 domain-containing protein, partial [Planctomycetota bacterium]|nr:DUF72 domain-containing protein [Planctomycetota bacterium]
MVEPVLNVVAGKVYAGTSGWSYQDWIGPFYEKGTASAEFLRSYSTRFPAVEVDSTFYAVPRRENVESWMKRTPDGFRFAFKVPGLVTHGAQGERPEPDK